MLTLGIGSGPLRVLCLGAHSDDIEIGCGGTLLRLLAERPGSSVDWVVFSATAERERESRASAADFLKDAAIASVRVEHFRESFFPASYTEIKECLGDVRRNGEPDLVFSHHVRDRHQDHRTVAELTWNAFRNHLVLEYEVAKYEGDLGQPNLFVPLTRATADRKVELLAKHFPTQADKPWFRPDTFHGLMSIRAVECQAPDGRAEAFHALKLVV
ncbi:MAG TPA: PIG-L deacetylase family protein [Polyangiales bacterium]|jgi:LmbE family N-acetylglucosaminyl deacetylase|nr:PIG-L deacetylase family protein [Polyangiales bacterium]